jgi:hypothetical protein
MTLQQNQQRQLNPTCQLATAAALLTPLLLTPQQQLTALLQHQGLDVGQCLTQTTLLTLMLMLITQHLQRESQQQQHQQPLGQGGAGLMAVMKILRSQQPQLLNRQQQQPGLGQWTGQQQQKIGPGSQLIGPQQQRTSLLHPQKTLLQQLHQPLSPSVMPLTHPSRHLTALLEQLLQTGPIGQVQVLLRSLCICQLQRLTRQLMPHQLLQSQ